MRNMQDSFKIISCKSSRLQDLGFVPGTIIKEFPSGFAKVFEIRGTKIAIRSSDFSSMVLEKVEESS